jgi:endonuclease/exonuclease/phosphatase family metal-dependent hydrolase
LHPRAADDGEHWLRLLSFNIQVGIRTERFSHYVTRGWRHLLPDVERQRNLDRIARVAHHFDLVALQEVDAGSLRSGFINQVEYLAHRGGFDYWYAQRNRDLGLLAQHANGLLARRRPDAIEDHKLPGLIPGRGAILLKYGTHDDPLVIVMLHLSLGGGARDRQLAYVRDLVAPYRRVVIMGDLNSHLDDLLNNTPLAETGLVSPQPIDDEPHATYPSWRPAVGLDHVLVSPALQVRHFRVLESCVSDHRPVAVEIELPKPTLH